MNEELKDINIRHIKLVSGDEILALVNKVDSRRHLIYVERPLVLSSFTIEGKEKHFLADWMPVSREELTAISAAHIVAQAEVNMDAKKAYIRFCTTGDATDPEDDDYDDELHDLLNEVDKSTVH